MRVLLASFLVLAGCTHAHANHPDTVTSVSEFDRVMVAGPFDVTIEVAPEAKIVFEGGDDAVEHVLLSVKNGALWIHDTGSRSSMVHVRVTTPNLRSASLAGSGDVRISGVETDAFALSVAGSGDIVASGNANTLTVKIAGSGSVDASALKTQSTDVHIAGSGDARVQATKTVKGGVTGSGDVEVSGGAKCSVRVSGSGDVSC